MFQLISFREFPGHSTWRGTQAEPHGLPELRTWSWESRKPRAARVHTTEYQRGKGCSLLFGERTPKVYRGTPPSELRFPVGACMWENYPRPGKDPWEDLQEQWPALTQSWEDCLFLPASLGALLVHRTLGKVSTRALHQERGIISPRLKVLCFHLANPKAKPKRFRLFPRNLNVSQNKTWEKL